MPEENQAPTPEPQVTDDGLGLALDELLKAADATSLSKAYGGTSVETGGRVDEDGASSGTLAGSGDVGGIDKLMVAKMSEVAAGAGVDAGTIEAFQAFMEGEDHDDDDDDDEDDEDEEKNGKMRGYKKKSEGASFQKSIDQFREDPDISDTIDVSPFLEALTARTADAIDAVRKSASHFEGRQDYVNQKMAKAVHQVGTVLKDQNQIIQALGERLNLVERQPAVQKGATQLSGAQPLSKALPNELGAGSGEPLTKSDILCTLTYMNLEKGIKHINGTKTSDLVGMFEGGNVIDQKTVTAVERFLSQNPNEADAARQYA